MTAEQMFELRGQVEELEPQPLIRHLTRSSKRYLKRLECEQPRDTIELRIVEAAFLFFTIARAKADQPLLEKILEIIRSGHLVVYCDPRLPGHELSFAEGCASRALNPGKSSPMDGRRVSGLFDYGMAMGLWKDGTTGN